MHKRKILTDDNWQPHLNCDRIGFPRRISTKFSSLCVFCGGAMAADGGDVSLVSSFLHPVVAWHRQGVAGPWVATSRVDSANRPPWLVMSLDIFRSDITYSAGEGVWHRHQHCTAGTVGYVLWNVCPRNRKMGLWHVCGRWKLQWYVPSSVGYDTVRARRFRVSDATMGSNCVFRGTGGLAHVALQVCLPVLNNVSFPSAYLHTKLLSLLRILSSWPKLTLIRNVQ